MTLWRADHLYSGVLRCVYCERLKDLNAEEDKAQIRAVVS
jgi:hypothetical protein